MDVPKPGYKVLSFLFIFILVVPVFSIYNEENIPEEEKERLSASSSYQLIPLTDGIGSGSVRMKIEDEAAVEFRQALLDSVSMEDDVLKEHELRLYLGEGGLLRSYIQRGDELDEFRDNPLFSRYGFKPKRDIDREERVRYQGLKIDSVRLPTQDIRKDTEGLVNTSSDDDSPICIDLRLNFESGAYLKRRHITPSDIGLLSSLWDSLILPVDIDYTENLTLGEKRRLEEGFQLPHEDLLVEEDRVQGIVVKNESQMEKEDYDFDSRGEVTIHDNLSLGDRVRFYYARGIDWTGTSEVTHWSFVLGTDSFRPRSGEGKGGYESLFMLRTPAGNILRYRYEYKGGEEDDFGQGLVWDGFRVLDNPQILFFLVALLSYASLQSLSYSYEKYRAEIPNDPEKIRWLHLGSKSSCLVLFILYFIPVIGPFFIGGFRLILISTGVSTSIIGLSRLVYEKKRDEILKSLSNQETRPILKKRLLKRSSRKKVLKKLKCRYCNAEFSVSRKRSPLTVLCPDCGKRIRKLSVNRSHLLIAGDKKRWGVYSLFIQFLSEGFLGLILTSHEGKEIESTHGINRDLVVKVGKASEKRDEIALSQLNSLGVTLMKRFIDDNKDEETVILVEGIGELYSDDEMGELKEFIDEMSSGLKGKDTTLLIRLDPENFSEEVLNKIKKSVDRWETL